MAAVDPGTMYLIMVAVIVISMILVSLFCNGSGKGKKNQRNREAERPVGQAAQRDAPNGARRRGPRRRMQRNRDSDDDEDLPMDAEQEDLLEDIIGQQAGKIGAKKMRKLQEKAERKSQRLAEEQEREERKQREKQLEAQKKKEEEKAKAEAEEREREEKIKKEEEEKREHEEYLKLKEMFIVEESGEADAEADLTSQSLLQEFIDYIKNMKVVMLEDLAGKFKIKTQDAINRVQELVAEGRLTGVIDDRGKFIYITMEELESVSKYIRQHGRVSICELAKSSNRLINLTPDAAVLQCQLEEATG